jgi:tetratricopeptide (TPR) repeat protein
MQRARSWLAWTPGLALMLALACRQSEHEVARTPAEPSIEPEVTQPLAVADPFMHAAATRFAPSLTAIGIGDAPPNGARVADYDHCGSCHEEISMQWRTSAHSFASFNNPIYRASIDRFREKNGVEASRFCAGCHDPALLVDGSMDAEIATDEARAHVGVGCLSCHGVESSTYDGNGSYVLAAREIPIPEMTDLASIERHRAAMGPARDQCGSCHRAFLGAGTGHPHHLNGTDEIGPWTDSSYTGNKLRLDTKVQEQDCADCHMPRQSVLSTAHDPAIDTDRMLRSHRFIGGHSWLAAMRGDDQTLARVREFLQGIASIDIAAVELDGERRLLGHGIDADARGRMVVDLVVRNLAVGHKFPGGTRDAQDTWIALSVHDAHGRMVAQLDDSAMQQGEVHRLRTGIVDEHGVLVDAREVESLRAVAFDNTIGPRDAVIVRYAVELPRDAVGPLTVEARLLHRSRTLALADETCRQAQTPRGRAFLRATAAITGQQLDACAEQPVTEISRHALTLGQNQAGEPARADHERLWELGIALQHQVQERLPEAREALVAAEVALERAGLEPAERDAAHARILAALGAVAAAQGRVDEALMLADRIAALAPQHPYPHLLRGRALAKVWRWQQAVPHLERAFEVSPGSPTLAGELAIAYGSAGMHREALALASKALPLRPRDATLLRAQALALAALDDPRAEAALELYFTHREPDDQPHLGAECVDKDPACALERVPVHVHESISTPKK